MEGRGDQWAGKHPAFQPKMIHPKLMQKGPPFMMPMMAQQGVFSKGSSNPNIMMHPGHAMMQMQSAMIPKYADMGAHIPPMMGHPGSGYIHPAMKMPPRGMMPSMQGQEAMSSCSPRSFSPANAGSSPVAVPQQRGPPRPMPTGQGGMMKMPSSKAFPPGFMGANVHQVMPAGGNLSPRPVTGKISSPGGLGSALSPKQIVSRRSPDTFLQSGIMISQPNRGSESPRDHPQMVVPPKVGPGGGGGPPPPMGMKIPPQMVAGGMNYSPMVGNTAPHMGIHGQRMGTGMPVPKPPIIGKGGTSTAPHLMKPVAPLLLGPPLGPAHPPGQQLAPENLTNGFNPPPKRIPEALIPNVPPPLPRMKLPEKENILSVPTLKEDDKCTLDERIKSAVSELINEQLNKAEGLYGQSFSLSDESAVVGALIEGFLPILDVLWEETKKAHSYSLDEAYLEFSNAEESGNKEEEDGGGGFFVVHREMDTLEEYYVLKKEIENLLASYRLPNKASQRDSAAAGPSEEKEMSALMKAQEYADVGYNQRHLVQKKTALDYRNALNSEECCELLPKRFRFHQIKMATSLHFDIRTPPQSVSPPAECLQETNGAETALSKCASSMENTSFLSAASKLMDKPSSNFMDKMPELPVLKLDMRYAKGLQVVPTPEMLMQLSSCNPPNSCVPMMFPKGVNFSMLPMPKMVPMRPTGPSPQIGAQNPRPMMEGEDGKPRPMPIPMPMFMKQPPSMYGGNLE